MNFGKIKKAFLFGGSNILLDCARIAIKRKLKVFVFTSKRHIMEKITTDEKTLKDLLNKERIKFFVTKDINKSKELIRLIDDTSIGIGFGEAWSFSEAIIRKFRNKLIDYMGIRLPQYRGGAHYTWKILRKNVIGCCNLQLINKDMIQGKYDSGEILKSEEFLFPADVRVPKDYIDFANKKAIEFLKSFFYDLEKNKEFQLFPLQENFSVYYPRLYTKIHGFINWNWDTIEIENFICAFDEPYAGASTFINGKRVFLKDCVSDYNDGNFHPFQSGLIYKTNNNLIFVCTKTGTLIIKKVLNEDGKNIISKLLSGQRFYTPLKYLEEALKFSAEYTAEGINKKLL